MKKETDFIQGFGTQIIHSGSKKDNQGALVTPIYQTSTFCFDTIEDGIDKFAGKVPGYKYSRGGNPTTDVLQEKIAALEGGEACVATASGMGAIGSVLFELLAKGDHIVCGDCLYGCTHVVLQQLEKFGVESTYVDTSDLEAVKSAIKNNTKVIYFETPSNPVMKITDIGAVAALAKTKDIKVIVDNTFAPPPVQYPLREGADLVVHSVTKYINGHGDVIGGAVVGKSDMIQQITANATTKICGSTPSPFNSFLVARGMQTLELRMLRHCENALKLAEFLESHEYVQAVYYPGLKSNPNYELAKRQMNSLFGGMISFEMKDGIKGLSSYEACKKLLNNLVIPEIAVSLGDPGTLIQHPASMTHANVPKIVQKTFGITENLIRLSVGLENTNDLIKDFEQALSKI